MDLMTGYAIAEFRMQQAESRSGAWQELENHYMPRTLAETHRLKREFEVVHMEEGEDPLVFLGRVDKAADELAMLGCGISVEEVNRHIVTNLSSLYTIQIKSIPSHPSIPRSEIDETIRDAYVNDKLEKEMVTKALGVKVGVDLHASYAGAVQPAGGAGTGSGSLGTNNRGGRYKQHQHQQQQQQQQQRGYPKQNCWDNSGPNPGDRFLQWVGYLPTHHRGLCRRCPCRRWEILRAGVPHQTQYHVVRGGYVSDAISRVTT